MKLSTSLSRPTALYAALMAFSHLTNHAQALNQTYCSSENTGSDFQSVYNFYQSNGACHDTCLQNYAYAVVQYQSCWCSNYAPADQVAVSECNVECPGFGLEDCGNAGQGLYGYVALSRSPSGTAGGSSSTSTSSSAQTSTQQATSSVQPSSTSSSASPSVPSSSSLSISSNPSQSIPSSPSQSSPSTVYETQTQVQTSYIPQSQPTSFIVSTITQTPTSSSTYYSPTSTSISTSTSSSSPSSIYTPSPTTSSTTAPVIVPIVATTQQSSSPTTTDDMTTPSPVISTRVVTVSGAPVTQTVTSTPVPYRNPDAANQMPQRKNVSSGTIAGAVVGAVAGVALLLALIFLLLRRRRSNKRNSGSSHLNRNASVLSKAGLLSTAGAGAGAADAEKTYDDPLWAHTNTNTRNSAILDVDQTPIATPAGIYETPSQNSRRNSRPLVYDQRLNPHALMASWENNGSRTSINTMQDQHDYSRPLNVVNPDPEH